MSELRGTELLRKAVHFSGLLYIPAYFYLGKETLLIVVAIIFAAAFAVEIARIRFGILSDLFRSYERGRFAAYFYYSAAILLITAIFDADSCIVAIICANLGDGVAGIVKRVAGKNAGSVAMLLGSVVAAVPLVGPAAIVACVAATLVERVDKVDDFYIDDNLSVPLAAAAVHSVTYIFAHSA